MASLMHLQRPAPTSSHKPISRSHAAPTFSSLAPRVPTARSHVQAQRVASAASPHSAKWQSQNHHRRHHHTLQHPCQRVSQRVVLVRCNPLVDTEEVPDYEKDFNLLSEKVKEATQELIANLGGCSIYLVGMMGSGKSTLGKMLANTLNYRFFDTDSLVEMAHDKKPVSEIFAEYGEDYFRNAEHEVVKQLAPYRSLVVATGGGIVIRPANWSHMQQGVVVWLSGPTELLARRVAKDGLGKRPLLGGDGVSADNLYDKTVAKLNGILEKRRQFYSNADVVISLEGHGADKALGAPAAVVLYRLMTALNAKIKQTREEREARRMIKVEGGGLNDAPASSSLVERPAQQVEVQ